LEMKNSGKNWRDDQQPGCFSLTGAQAGATSEAAEAIFCRDDGRVFQLRVTAGPFQDSEGTSQGCLVTMVDLTAQKEAEENLRQADEKVNALLEASPLPIISLDFEARVQVWNRAAEKLFGWSKDEVLGRVIPTVPPDRQGESQELLEREKRGENLSGIETQRLARDGRLVDIVLHTGLIHDKKGEPTGAMAVLEDISERKQSELKIARQNAVLSGINEVGATVSPPYGTRTARSSGQWS
jgi:PAS domain S-box-containing protein